MVKSIIFTACLLTIGFKSMACIDSMWYDVEAVQCFGLRNGKININKVFGGIPPYHYSIDGQSFSTNPQFDRLWAGSYVIYIRDGSNCIKTINLSVKEPLEMQVRLFTADSSVVAGKSFVIKAFVTPEVVSLKSISWQPSDLFPRQDTLRQQVSIAESTNVHIELIDNNGCVAHNNLIIKTVKPDIFVPNAIKPDSDNNGIVTIFSGEGIKVINSFQVFDRNGKLLFSRISFLANDLSNGWNGRWNGKKVPPGAYLWRSNITLLDGTIINLNGTVAVID